MISSDHSYNKLRRQILEGILKPGSALKERELCEEMGVSRTPIREALRRLVAEGLAEMRPRRSIVVTQYGEKELAEIFELGSLLETHVAGMAAEKASPNDLTQLEDIIARMEELLSSGSGDLSLEYARLDQELHDRIAAAARNGRIAQMLRQTVSLRWMAQFMQRYDEGAFRKSLDQHRQIIAAIAQGDTAAARQAMASHVGSGRQIGRVDES